MMTINAKNKGRMVLMTVLMCLLASFNVMAFEHRGGFHGGGFHGGWGGGFHHSHLWGGFYIGSEWFWGPTLIVEGVPYYYYRGDYYTMADGQDLVAVAAPQVKVAPTMSPSVPAPPAPVPAKDATKEQAKVDEKTILQPGEIVSINVPNASGGYTQVKLTKKDNGYIGPQGEFYTGNPTVAELRALYGK
jgi:hypothetical protein